MTMSIFMAGVMAGATQVQGTINGYGERVGNCDLVPIIANLSLKLGVKTLPEECMEKAWQGKCLAGKINGQNSSKKFDKCLS